MEGRCAVVETSPSPFSSATSPSHEVGGQSRSGLLPGGCCGAKVDSNTNVVHNHLRPFPEVVVIKDSVA